MAINLSEGSIHDIITKPAEEHPKKPILQILGVRKISANQGNKGSDRYRLVLSDGALIHTSAMLATQLNDRVVPGEIEMKAIISLDKYICNIIQKTRKVLIILECEVIKPASEVPGKIGNPKSAADLINGTQPQQNGHHDSAESDSFGGQQNTPAQRQPLQQQNKGFGGSSFGKGYGSNQPVNRGGDGHKTVFPISGLTPYQNRWTIRARVTSKSGIRTWSNSRGEGKLFNVEFVDESGEIRATGFNDAVDKFYDLLEINKVFYVTKGSLKTANKQYSSVKNDYEMYLNNDTNIEVCTEECDLPSIQYNFINIGDLENVDKDTMVDVLGVCSNAAEVTQITTRATNKQVSKRDLTLVDRSEKSVSATLWGDDAEKFEEHVGKTPVLAIKGAKVSDFGGRSLSIMSSSNLRINPLDLKEAMSLRGWYDNAGKNQELQSISNQRYGDAGGGKLKFLSSIKSEELGMGEKPDYLAAKGTIVYLKRENCLYQACPTDDCNKKVIPEDDGYRCEKCNKKYPDFKHRLILSAHVADFTYSQWVTCFQESAEAILGRTAKEVGELRDSGNEAAFDTLFTNGEFKSYVFRIRAKMETYNEETRLKCSIVGVKPIDYKQDSKRLIEEIQKLMNQ